MQRILILEDESIAAVELKKMLKALHKEILVEKVLPSVKESIVWLQSHNEPDIIFSDIVLNDGTCFDLFKKVNVSCPIIYCTAYNKYAIEAFRNNGVDYLLKPINFSDLELSFIKMENIKYSFAKLNNVHKDMQRLMARCDTCYQSTILCHFREQIIPLPTNSINYISSESRLAHVYTEEKSYTINKTLDQVMSRLNPYQFFRVNRHYAIHRNAIQSISKVAGRKLNVKLTCPDSPIIIVSKDKSSEFKQWLEGTFID